LSRTLAQLNPEELQKLYDDVIVMRNKILDFVQAFDDMDANKLVSKTFQHEIEKEYGRKILKELNKK